MCGRALRACPCRYRMVCALSCSSTSAAWDSACIVCAAGVESKSRSREEMRVVSESGERTTRRRARKVAAAHNAKWAPLAG